MPFKRDFCKWICRVFPTCLSTWMWVDMALDTVQTINYYSYAFNDESTYQIWLQGQCLDQGSECKQLNPAYFRIAAAIWAFTPAFLTLFCLAKGLFKFGPEHPQGPGSHQTVALFGGLWFVLIFAFQVKISDFITVDVHPAAVPLIWIYHLPINFVGSIIGIYVLIPVTAMILSLRILFKGHDNYSVGMVIVDDLPGHKMFEVVGEAFPQLILNLVYIGNNFEFLMEHDKITPAQPLPTCVVSAVFSLGSVIIGFLSAGNYWCTCGQAGWATEEAKDADRPKSTQSGISNQAIEME